MKTPEPSEENPSATWQGAQIINPGEFPAKLNTVTAEVLERMLNQQRLTSLDGVSEASTTRLSAVTHYLAKKYGWAIEVHTKAVGCGDGRVAWVAEYFLAPETIACAMAAGAGIWCEQVRAARRARRALSVQARRIAERANSSRSAGRSQPGQQSLFD